MPQKRKYPSAEERIAEADQNFDWVQGALKVLFLLSMLYLIFHKK